MSKRYLLDANPFIEAKNRYYGFDICPGFWTSIIELHEAKWIFSIDRIRTELADQDDELRSWADAAPETLFKKTDDQNVIGTFQQLLIWVYAQQQFTDAAKAEFASVADGWVIAYAAVNRQVVVTHEEFAPNAQRKVPMPNVCIEFGVEYVNTFEMLRQLSVSFVRSTKRRRN